MALAFSVSPFDSGRGGASTGTRRPFDLPTEPRVLLVPGLVNCAITPRSPGMAEILKDLIYDQHLVRFMLKTQKWSVAYAPL